MIAAGEVVTVVPEPGVVGEDRPGMVGDDGRGNEDEPEAPAGKAAGPSDRAAGSADPGDRADASLGDMGVAGFVAGSVATGVISPGDRKASRPGDVGAPSRPRAWGMHA